MKTIRAMKGPLLVVILVGLILSLSSCHIVDPDWDRDRDSARNTFSYEIEVEEQEAFKIEGINGDIDIRGTNDDTVLIWGERIVRADNRDDAEWYLDQLRVRVSTYEDEIYVRTDQPRNIENVDFEVIYHVEIPDSWRVNVDHVNGDVLVKTLQNRVSVDLTNGDIGLDEIYGQVWTELVNGDVDADVILSDGDLCRIGVTNGDIRLAIPRDTSAELYAQVTNGEIMLTNLELSDMSSSRQFVSGILGDGDGLVDLRTTNGDIEVRGY